MAADLRPRRATADVRLVGHGLYLRPLLPHDARGLAEQLARNREFQRPFDADRPDEEFTPGFQRARIQASVRAWEHDAEYVFGIFAAEDDRLLGRIGLHMVSRAHSSNAVTGYHVDRQANGQGYATQALGLLLGFAFDTLGLHRVEAGVMPANEASIRVLEKNGFRWEGIQRRRLLIAGRWEDHWSYAITQEDWRDPARAQVRHAPAEVSVRRATVEDLEVLVELRMALLLEGGYADADPASVAMLTEATRAWLRARLPEEQLVCWAAEAAGRIVAAAAYIVLPRPPSRGNPRGDEAYVLNVYTHPEWRGRGIAKRLMRECLAHIRATGMKRVRLHTAPAARSLYRRMGFEPIDYEMRANLP